MNKNIISYAAVAVLLPANAFSANLLTNGDFESFNGNTPNNWTRSQDIVTTNVTGLAGSASAVQLGATGTANSSALTQSPSSGLSATIFFQFDFQILTTGNEPSDGDRTVNFTLRAGNTSIINARSFFNGTADDGTLEFFNGSGWQAITGQTELFNQTDAYRFMLSGDISGATPSYDVSLMNLTDNTSAGGQAGITSFQTTIATLTDLRLERGRSSTDYIVDNVYLSNVAIPEPSTGLLSLLGAGLLFRRRR